MDELSLAIDILKSFDEVEDIRESKDDFKYISFVVEHHNFLMLCPKYNIPSSKVTIFVLDEVCYDYPHIVSEGFNIPDGKSMPKGNYRSLCLYEDGSVIMSLLSYEEKIVDATQRLLELLHLSATEIEREFQKEFLYYWNDFSKDREISVYIGDVNIPKKMNVYISKEDIRCVAPGIRLNDKEKKDGDDKQHWKHMPDLACFYIPIIDNRGLLPPMKGKEWSGKEIINIVYGKQISHIARESFEFISNEQIKTSQMILAFGMVIDGARKVFSAIIKFKSAERKSVIKKIINDIESLQVIKTTRLDYSALNEAIGNRTNISDKRVLIIGAGSLGSYIASELVKNGIKNITVYDGDKLEAENIMRWAYGGFGRGMAKPYSLKLFLEFLHPEIHVNAVGTDIDEEKLIEEVQKQDLIISTIGNSDDQLLFNSTLKKNGCLIPVIYTWIEAGGNHSHILRIDYNKPGCFQCLYTNDKGELVNNRANIITDTTQDIIILRNGCGGTRAPYGTAVLLRTTSVLLDIVDDVFEDSNKGNYLVNISRDSASDQTYDYIERMCACCGRKRIK